MFAKKRTYISVELWIYFIKVVITRKKKFRFYLFLCNDSTPDIYVTGVTNIGTIDNVTVVIQLVKYLHELVL